MASLISTIYYINFSKEIQSLDQNLFNEIRLCSFDLKCTKYKIDFVLKKEQEFYKLYKDENGLAGYFPIQSASLNILKIYYPITKYKQDEKKIFRNSIIDLSISMLIVLIFAIVFALYTLYPLRNALHLTQEFVKDILHDFNTPLSTLRLNVSMLEKELGENKKLNRISKSVQNILNLQDNLRRYLANTPLQKEKFELQELITQRVEILSQTYEHLNFEMHVSKQILLSNKDAFTRIVDNILSNAVKYNKENGYIKVYTDKNPSRLSIEDSGKGIHHPEKVFDRFYKEHERGIGIGLHIVKKLADELNIKIEVQTQLGVGTVVTLYL